MKRSVRNRLGDLLLEAFADPEKRAAIAWLGRFCDLAAGRDRPEVSLADLLAEQPPALSGMDYRVEAAFAHLVGSEKLLQFRCPETGEMPTARMPTQIEGLAWLVELQSDVRTAFAAICERARIYANLAAHMGEGNAISASGDPLRKAMAEAAMCFNAGLFFEAHEHLEHHWAAQPKGPTKRFLQGIIQISVGFHHAHSGNYDGAVNQLAKGLEKTIGTTGEMFGLGYDAFLPKVAAVREAIVRRGRAQMRPLLLAEIPRMLIRG
jgi:hypothetical protein